MSDLPCGWQTEPVGCDLGESTFTSPDIFTLTTEGCYDPSFYRLNDQQGFINQELCGDSEIITQVTDATGTGWAGIAMRESNDPSARMIQLMIDGQSLTRREARLSPNAPAYAHVYPTQGKNWLRLTRVGNQFSAYHSLDGSNWEVVFTAPMPMATCIKVGLITMNGTPSGEVTGVFENVSVLNGSISPLIALPTDVETNLESRVQPTVKIAPNPFVEQANITITVTEAGMTNIAVFNAQGQLVKQLHQGYLDTGDHLKQWNGADQNGKYLPNGIYFLRMEMTDQIINEKMLLQQF